MHSYQVAYSSGNQGETTSFSERFKKKGSEILVSGSSEVNPLNNTLIGGTILSPNTSASKHMGIVTPQSTSSQGLHFANSGSTGSQNYVKSYTAYKASNYSNNYTTPVYAYNSAYARAEP